MDFRNVDGPFHFHELISPEYALLKKGFPSLSRSVASRPAVTIQLSTAEDAESAEKTENRCFLRALCDPCGNFFITIQLSTAEDAESAEKTGEEVFCPRPLRSLR
jgi:hypothetical protein